MLCIYHTCTKTKQSNILLVEKEININNFPSFVKNMSIDTFIMKLITIYHAICFRNATKI